MFDTMTMTKAVGGLCGAFLIFLMGNWAAETLYHVGSGGHGGDSAQAYSIELPEAEETDSAEADDAPEVDFAALVAVADAAAGEKVYGKCKSCHKEPGANGTGPTLHGVVGRDIASVDGFGGYSDALIGLPGDWEATAVQEAARAPPS